ncbi:MAG TPA: thiamine diphosphokinase [Xanthomonadales bacterium]|nr:thiamine diphosphokinase [Xanthomonadales bacterium]
MHFVIFTGGTLQKDRAVEKVLKNFDKIIAVDSGASHCDKFKLIPDFVVGDFDSIDKKLLIKFEKLGSKILRFPEEKNETDTEIGIQTAIDHGATKISVLGGLAGDRIDHILANVLIPIRYKIPVYFASGNQTLWLAKGPKTEKIKGSKTDLLSLIPLSPTVDGIATKGLKYVLGNEKLNLGKTRGVSNVFMRRSVEVNWKKGTLLLIHTSLA